MGTMGQKGDVKLKTEGSRSLFHMQRKLPEGRRNSILKSTWKKGIRQKPRREPALTRLVLPVPRVLTQESPTVPGVLLGTHPTVHTSAPLLNLSSAPQTTGTPLAAADKATEGSWGLMPSWRTEELLGRTLQGAGEPLNHSARSISAHSLLSHFTRWLLTGTAAD